MTDLDTKYIHADSIVMREIAGEVILVPIRNNVGNLESIYTLNETAATIWALLDRRQLAGTFGIKHPSVEQARVDRQCLSCSYAYPRR